MSSLPRELLEGVLRSHAADAWKLIVDATWAVTSEPLPQSDPTLEIRSRDARLASLDLLISDAAWELWTEFESSVEAGAARLISWWQAAPAGRAVLILDALSLREVPWLLQGAEAHGMRVRSARAARSELPGDTVPFARALGWPGRSALANSFAASGVAFSPARTESVNLPFDDCLGLVGSEPDWVFWHHWPDHRLHELDRPNQGFTQLTREAEQQLGSTAFWKFVRRLAQGRRLVLTSDHGYAATGFFASVEGEQELHLRARFKRSRSVPGSAPNSPWLPPSDLGLISRSGAHQYALGRRRWSCQSGYPTLTHGGLSLLEVLVPFIELECV